MRGKSQEERIYNSEHDGDHKLCFTNLGHTHARVNLLVQSYAEWIHKSNGPIVPAKNGEWPIATLAYPF